MLGFFLGLANGEDIRRAAADLVDYCAVVGWIASGQALSSRIYSLIWAPCFSRFCVTIFIYIKRETKILFILSCLHVFFLDPVELIYSWLKVIATPAFTFYW